MLVGGYRRVAFTAEALQVLPVPFLRIDALHTARATDKASLVVAHTLPAKLIAVKTATSGILFTTKAAVAPIVARDGTTEDSVFEQITELIN